MDFEKQTVVIVDDEDSTLLTLTNAIETLAHVVAVSDSNLAFSVIARTLPSLVVLDISMPGLSGFDIFEQLKSSSNTATIPVIFVTSHSDQENEAKALSLGAIDFIPKPIDVSLCQLRVRNHLVIQHQRAMLFDVNRQLELEKKQLDVTLRSIADGVISTDASGNITFINPVAQRLTGYSEAEALGKPINEIMNLKDASTETTMLNPALYALEVKRPVAMAYNAILISKHNQVFRVEDTASPIIDYNGNLTGSVIVFQDVSEAVEMAVKMTHLTNHDQLTGLPNRVLLHDRVVQAITRSITAKQSVALLLIDIDNFKYLNDSLGHQVGDYIIASVAKRLSIVMKGNATLARVGGDEFACLVSDLGSGFTADTVALSCLEKGREPIEIDGKAHQLSLSIGISLYPQDASNAEEMMRHADTAMYRSKSTGKDMFTYFSEDLQHAMHHRVETEICLRNAIENDFLAIHMQPKYKFGCENIVSAEALVRLYDESGNITEPDVFVPLAEETGLIHLLGKQVLRKSCEFVAKCNAKGVNLKVAVNVASKQLADPGFASEVKQIIEKAGISPSSIELEVTESALMHDFEQTRTVLNSLASLGVTIALDDFGTGYSSLSYLRQFPINVLKIDRSFVIDMDKEQQAYDIVTAIVQLALSLDLTIVAEGIETKNHYDSLQELGCHYGQGYHMCKPITLDAFFEKFIMKSAVA